MRACYRGLLIWLSVVVCAHPSWAEINLDFGVYTSDKPTVMIKKFRPVLTDLQQDLAEILKEPVRIRIQVANTYDKGIEALVAGKVDFARLGPASYVEAAERNPRLRIIAMESRGGLKRFNGVICVVDESEIHTVEDLRGKRFAFGNARSTIGRYLSQQYLMTKGVKASDLGHYDYLQRHDQVGYAVASGEYDAGALKEGTYKRLVKKKVPLRTIAVFPNVTKPWVASSGMDDRVFAGLKQSLLRYRDSEGRKGFAKDGFLEGTDEDYVAIRAAMRGNEQFFR